MKDSSIAIAGLPDDFVAKDDEGLFAFINALRLSVRARVAEEQQRGMSLSEIVVEVREMVRFAEHDVRRPTPFPARAFKAISRQAIAWCVEAYRPVVITTGNDFSAVPNEPDPQSLRSIVGPAGASARRLPAQSPNSRGLP